LIFILFFKLKISALLSASLVPITIVTEDFDKTNISTETLKVQPLDLMAFNYGPERYFLGFWTLQTWVNQ
jgi:hypothetical protein